MVSDVLLHISARTRPVAASKRGDEERDQDPDAADGDMDGDEGKKPNPKKAKKSGTTPGLMIEKDPDNLNAEFDFGSRIDPLFQKTAAAFDEGGWRVSS